METVLRVSGLGKSYGDLKALEGFDLELGRGEIFGLLGHNGAGKTTAIECMLGTRRRDAGEALLFGLDPVTERKKVFARTGVQFQDFGYQDKIRVGELCAFQAALFQTGGDWPSLLERFGLGKKRRAPVNELSGGERQKLSLVLALVHGPELIFLDELTTGLDPKARREIWAYIKGLKAEGKTVFLSSHYMDEVEFLCDRIAILKSGKVVARGSPAELVEENGSRNLEEAFLLYLERDPQEEARQ